MNKTPITLEYLKSKKIRFWIEHLRFSNKKKAFLPLKVFKIMGTQDEIAAKSGITILTVKNPNGKVFTSISNCGPHDSYKNRLGIAICLKRLEESVNIQEW